MSGEEPARPDGLAPEPQDVEQITPAEPEGGTPAEPASNADLARQLEEARAVGQANYDRFLRAAAELDNYRKRTARIRTEAREDALREVLLQIAPVLDNLSRAMAQDTQDAGALRQGVELILNQFRSVLRGNGLVEIEAVGQPFDPNLHEALLQVESEEHPAGTVIDEMEKGYTLNSRVVRPARVVVSKAAD